MKRLAVEVRGIVQGVGFRPFAARRAMALGLAGFVRNTPSGVELECEGPAEACGALVRALQEDPPPGAVLFSVQARELPPRGETGFRILTSGQGAAEAAVSPDLGICPDCARELFDPADRRYRYPFINCTACGPRFTILEKIPYDRANTTMAGFQMCPQCAAEYADPFSRRFHAQPDACAVCGPRLTYVEGGAGTCGDVIGRFQRAILAGGVVAVKGLGGYHLACSAQNPAAVRRLREAKHRYAKPLAVMAPDLAAARALCLVSPEEEAELLSPRRPIVLLKKREHCAVAPEVAPGNGRLGVMLPYTPLHLLLLEHMPPLVKTSANLSDAPMPYRDEDLSRVLELCGAAVTHNRPILRRMDDSVCVFAAGQRRLFRRARGFAPAPVPVRTGGAAQAPQLLAFGAQLKNTFCLMKDGRAYLSGHMGDLDDEETLRFFRRELPAFLALFGAAPEVLVSDLHPDYASTRLAQRYAAEHPGTRLLAVQHHQAHFASVLAEQGLEAAAGFIFDGAGYGTDGTSWGGELLAGTAARPRRLGRLRPLRLPGGDAAVREPWRAALCAVADACGSEKALSLFAGQDGAEPLLRLAARGVCAPLSTGMGRLFDVFAAVAGLPPRVSFEGQDAMALEQAFDDTAGGSYGFDVVSGPGGLLEFDWREAVRCAVADRERGEGPGVISARFHRAAAGLVRAAARECPDLPVVLSGGVFQNLRLLESCLSLLEQDGRKAYANSLVPSDDGGICYGQAAAAAALLKE